MSERLCGNVRKSPIGALADTAARGLMEYASPRAVSLYPCGAVYIEALDDAAECDLIGAYSRDLGLLELSRRLVEDLGHETQARGLRPARKRNRSPEIRHDTCA